MHHVTARSVAEEYIFRDAGDYATALRILAEVVAEGLLTCHMFASCRRTYHLLGTFDDLSRAVHKLNRRYATRFNRRYGRHGHVFDSPCARIPIRDDDQLATVVRYIASNPPNPERWPFASYPALIGLSQPFSFVDPAPVWGPFHSAKSLRAFVEDGKT